MKKIVFLSALLGAFCTLSAQNTFPTTGNVGIGVSTPSSLLQVAGDLTIGSSSYLNQTKIYFKQNDNVSAGWSLGSVGANSNDFMVYSYESTGNFKIYTGTLERMVVKSDGKVGIGITNPTVALDVNGSIKTTGTLDVGYGYFKATTDTQLRLYGLDTWAGITLKDTNGTDYFWFNGQHKTFSIGGGGSNVANKKLHIEGGTSIGTGYRNSSIPVNGLAIEGNVGIGTLNPNNELDVDGAIGIITGTTPIGKIYNFAGAVTIEGDSTRDVMLGSATNQNALFVEGTNGNIGIGTVNPDEKFVVQTTDAYRNVKFKAPNGEERFKFYVGGTGNPSSMFMYDSDGTSNTIKLNGAAAGVSFINGGNVGIGTSSPQTKLHIEKNNGAMLRLSNDLNNYLYSGIDGGGAYFEQVANTSGKSKIRLQTRNSNQGTYSQFFIDGGNSNFSFLNGNVGIGTSTPSSKLVIRDNNQGLSILINKKLEGTSLATTEDKTVTLSSTGTSSGSIAFATGNDERMRVKANGYVGIGTTDPVQKLDLHGNMLFQNNTELRWRDAGGVQRTILELDTNNDLFFGKSSGGNLIFVNGTSYTEQMRLDVNGNLGIGTTTMGTGYKLSVAGKVITEEVKVKLQSSGWPDYVFTKEYKLPTLVEVEKQIKQKGHLKDIPSAKEVAKNGIFIGEMNAKLLQKIEELTLYTIQQEKEIQKLKKQDKRIEELEKLVKKLLEEKK